METCDPGGRDALRRFTQVHKNVHSVNSSTRKGALMNVRTALISSALLVAVLGWACEQGPTSPSALGTPGGSSLGGVSLDAAGGAILGANPPCVDDDERPQCKPKGDGGDGDPAAPTLTLTDGMQTTSLAVTVKEVAKTLKVSSGDFVHVIQMAFTNPKLCKGIAGTGGVSSLPTDAEIEALIEEGRAFKIAK